MSEKKLSAQEAILHIIHVKDVLFPGFSRDVVSVGENGFYGIRDVIERPAEPKMVGVISLKKGIRIGTAAQIVRGYIKTSVSPINSEMAVESNQWKLELDGAYRFKIKMIIRKNKFYLALVEKLPDLTGNNDRLRQEALACRVKENFGEIMPGANVLEAQKEMWMKRINTVPNKHLAYYAAYAMEAGFGLDNDKKQRLLRIRNVAERLKQVFWMLEYYRK